MALYSTCRALQMPLYGRTGKVPLYGRAVKIALDGRTGNCNMVRAGQ